MKDLIILGAGGAGWDITSICCAINKEEPTWNILGYLDDNTDLIGKEFNGYKVLDTIDNAVNYSNAYFVSSIANPHDRMVRRRIFDRVKSKGLRFAVIIHPSAILYNNVKIGEGSVVNALCVLGTNAKLKDDVHLGYSCTLAHEITIGTHCAMGTGVNISSGVKIGDDCYIGAGVSTSHDINIEADTLVTVGASVVRNLCTNKEREWIGVPAVSVNTYINNNQKIKSIKI